MDSSHETSTEAFEDGPITPSRIAAIAALFDVIAFTAIGYIALESPLIGAFSGLLVGTGVYCFLPIFMLSESRGGLEAMADEQGSPFQSLHRVAAGLALSGGGIIPIAVMFMELDPFIAATAGIIAAVVLYIPLSFVLPNAKL
ncbi:hypothetical protein G6M89_04330 [Natronolimnobius sp. AArcel1]|uniref:hypothetical protein n=1 Tax=Natronolimnobius sp. AArcel1 TaxID=1679093 RepID=UPI0013EA7450|nr:hypothetical protein [Natronolimnobius sp. AArcel1]NGM68242.1 hypothetical protein [Natronolimnobius sp. AArcel1]